MLGAITGDIIGSRFERHNTSREDFSLFTEHSRITDDSILTLAVAEALLHGQDMAATLRKWVAAYPTAGYGPNFLLWAGGRDHIRFSKGNGAAMRTSPVAWWFDTLDDVLMETERQAALTHNSEDGLAGAKAIAAAVFLARSGGTKEDIKAKALEVAPSYRFSWPPRDKPKAMAKDSVPVALAAFFVSSDFEDAIRKAISVGGDSDTVASMAGAVSEAFYGSVPGHIREEVMARLPETRRTIVDDFYRKVTMV